MNLGHGSTPPRASFLWCIAERFSRFFIEFRAMPGKGGKNLGRKRRPFISLDLFCSIALKYFFSLIFQNHKKRYPPNNIYFVGKYWIFSFSFPESPVYSQTLMWTADKSPSVFFLKCFCHINDFLLPGTSRRFSCPLNPYCDYSNVALTAVLLLLLFSYCCCFTRWQEGPWLAASNPRSVNKYSLLVFWFDSMPSPS